MRHQIGVIGWDQGEKMGRLIGERQGKEEERNRKGERGCD